MKTTELIDLLSQEAPRPGLKPPVVVGLCLGLILAAYGVGIQFFLGLRPDLIMQFARPAFAMEILLLVLLAMTSVGAAILSMYPDSYQKKWMLRLPYAVFGALAAYTLLQFVLPHDARMVMPLPGAHGMECALCIASVSLVPSALIFGLLRQGASVHPLRAGSFAVLAASSIGCLTLRLAESNDSIMHLANWHYLPTLLFAVLGAIIGRFALKW